MSALKREFSLLGKNLYLSGAILTELSAHFDMNLNNPNQRQHYTDFHVDRANVAAYHWSALLYLDSYGLDFTGAELEFADPTTSGDRIIIQPRVGRLLLFTSGHENLHRVRPLSYGRRRVLAVWFSCNAEDDLSQAIFQRPQDP